MRKTMRFLAALGAALAVVVGLAACGSSSVPSSDVAVVAGNPISLQAYNHWLYVADKGNALQDGGPTVVPTDPPQFTSCIAQIRAQIPTYAKTSAKTLRGDCKEIFTQLNSTVMDFLIKAYWYQGTAAKDGKKYTAADAKKAFAQAKKETFPTTAEYKEFLAETGETVQDIDFRLRVNTLFSDLITADTPKITTATIDKYYQAHETEFGTPEERDVKLIQTTSQANIEKAEAAVKSGQSWASVAKQYSTDTATKSTGGVIKNLQSGQVEQTVSKAIFAAPLNTLEGPIHGSFGYYLVEVTKITPATKVSLAKATPEIKELLTEQNQQSAENKVNAQAKREWGSATHCAPAYEMADCAGYKAPSTTTATTPAASSGAAGATVTQTPSTVTATTSGTSTK